MYIVVQTGTFSVYFAMPHGGDDDFRVTVIDDAEEMLRCVLELLVEISI